MFLEVPAFLLAILAVVLAAIALSRGGKVGNLSLQVQDIDEELRRLRRRVRTLEQRGPEPAAEEARYAEVLPADLATVEPLPETEAPRPGVREEPAPVGSAIDLESWIGRKALGWIAVVLLLFAVGFFVQYAYENRWIGPLGRIWSGTLAGIVLCAFGFRQHRRGQPLLAQMLTGAGTAVLYLITYAAFGFYNLLPTSHAAVFLVLIVAETALLSVLYRAPAIAVIATIGGLLSPLLLPSERDQYQSLFVYLFVLDAAVVALGLLQRWRFLAPIALAGSQLLFWLWWGRFYHPEKLLAALLFQAGLFGLFLLHDVVTPAVRRQRADVLGLAGLLGNAFLFSLAGSVLLWDDYRVWLGSGALGLALVYAGLGRFAQIRRPDDPRLLLTVVAVGMAFVAAAFALEARAGWIAVCWAVQGGLLVLFALRISNLPLRLLGLGVLLLATVRLLVDIPWDRRDLFLPLFNAETLPALAVATCVLITAGLWRYFPGGPDDPTWGWRRVVGLTGLALLWLVLSNEVYQFFWLLDETSDSHRTALTSLSVFWAVDAAALLALGFRLGSLPVRGTALGLFGLTLGKVILIDMAGLPGFYRILAFLVLAVMLGGAAWGYQILTGPRPIRGARP